MAESCFSFLGLFVWQNGSDLDNQARDDELNKPRYPPTVELDIGFHTINNSAAG